MPSMPACEIVAPDADPTILLLCDHAANTVPAEINGGDLGLPAQPTRSALCPCLLPAAVVAWPAGSSSSFTSGSAASKPISMSMESSRSTNRIISMVAAV